MDTIMNRGQAVLAKADELDEEDARYWAIAGLEEKLRTITYLRECFYGPEATTGRLQGFYQIIRQK
jgi:hypothetical protein